jgi:hypothetical protein
MVHNMTTSCAFFFIDRTVLPPLFPAVSAQNCQTSKP